MRGENRSVVKTIRLSSDLSQYLSDEAKKSNQTSSAFITSVLQNYRNKYQFMEKLGSMAIRPMSMSYFVNSIDEKGILEIANTISSDFLLLVPNLMGQEESNWFEWGIIEFLPSINWYRCLKSNQGCMITHNMGKGWTMFLQCFFSSLIDKYPGDKPLIEVEKDTIMLKPRTKHKISSGVSRTGGVLGVF